MNIVDMIRYAEPNNWSDGDYEKTLIVIHATVTREEVGGARLVGSWFNDPDFNASTQYTVDAREVIQSVPDTAYAWSAGTTANVRGIHVEMVGMPGQSRRGWSDAYSDDELALAADLVAGKCREFGIPARKIGPAAMRRGEAGICGHDDVRDAWGETTHWDPGPNFPWDRFIRMVRNADARQGAERGELVVNEADERAIEQIVRREIRREVNRVEWGTIWRIEVLVRELVRRSGRAPRFVIKAARRHRNRQAG